MVIDQYFHCLSLVSQFKFLRHAQFASTCIVIDQYLHAPSFSSHVSCLDLTNFDSTCTLFRYIVPYCSYSSCCCLYEVIFDDMLSVVNV